MVILASEPDAMLNQTTYVLENRLYQQSFLNRDSFLNRAFLNQDSTVCMVVKVLHSRYHTRTTITRS